MTTHHQLTIPFRNPEIRSHPFTRYGATNIQQSLIRRDGEHPIGYLLKYPDGTLESIVPVPFKSAIVASVAEGVSWVISVVEAMECDRMSRKKRSAKSGRSISQK